MNNLQLALAGVQRLAVEAGRPFDLPRHKFTALGGYFFSLNSGRLVVLGYKIESSE